MSYSKQLSSNHPGLFLFLIDQSGSMSDKWGGDGNKSKADQVADVLNKFLRDLTLRCAKSNEIRKRINVGVIGYGNPNNVSPAFLGSLAGKDIVDIAEVATNPARVEQRTKKESDGAGGIIDVPTKFPIWIESMAFGGTPMKEGFAYAKTKLQTWVQQHPDSYPPIVINITDGEYGSDPRQEIKEIKNLSTNDGEVLVFNIHISSSNAAPIFFPMTSENLNNTFAKDLYEFSSVLPDSMAARAAELYPGTTTGARGFAFNGDLVTLVNFLDIGSTVDMSNKS